MSEKSLEAELSQAVYELTTVEPHVPPGVRFASRDWPVYCAGYLWALVAALRVIEHRARVRTLRERAAAPAERAAVDRYFWRVMRWERLRRVETRARGAA